MSSQASTSKGSSVVSDIKSGLKGIRGAGEAIRGNVNQSVDTAFNDKEGQAKNHAVAAKGVEDMERTDQRLGEKHGLTTGGVGATGATTNTTSTGEVAGTSTGPTTGVGAHSGVVGNLHSQPVAADNLAAEPESQTQRF